MRTSLKGLALGFALSLSTLTYAAQYPANVIHLPKKPICCCRPDTSLVGQRAHKEAQLLPNYFAITTYKQNYLLPYYFTGSPYNSVYQRNTPRNEQIKHGEVKYQFSLKVPLWREMFGSDSSIYGAYTQLSYWQLYNQKAFFRENDYEPEIFLANKMHRCLFRNWQFNFLNVGAVHQSNGMGNFEQRGWDRVYLEAIASNNHWMVDVKPWFIYMTNGHNKDIGKYMGYGSVLISYKYNQQVFSFQARNFIESYARHATGEATWSFPLIPYVKGFVQVFSGYGQSLIEYNHRTNSAGVGLALSDWV